MAAMTMEIKVNAPDCAADLASLDAACFSSSDAISAKEWKKLLLRTQNVIVYVHDDSDLMGAAVGTWAAGVGYLYSNAVMPRFRRQGLGLEMIEARINILRSNGCARVHAHTRVENRISRDLLKRVGFKAIQYVPDHYGDFEDGVLWEAIL